MSVVLEDFVNDLILFCFNLPVDVDGNVIVAFVVA
jgi:hypothetical protein